MNTPPKERPILFSTAMVQAILNGDKTETRRVIKPQPDSFDQDDFGWVALYEGQGQAGTTLGKRPKYGLPGDLLWVRETHSVFKQGNGSLQREKTKYKADPQWDGNDLIKWKPSIYMPKAAARIWLEIVEVKAQRLQDMREKDARAEGVTRITYWAPDGDEYTFPCFVDKTYEHPTAIDCFQALWTSINGEASWQANPWVWAIKYRVLSTTGHPNTTPPNPNSKIQNPK